jgi:hypothetical protein
MVKVGSCIKCLAGAATLLLLCSGCGGIAATPSFSPLMLFFPEAALFSDVHSTNVPSRVVAVKPVVSTMQLAQAQQ